MVAEFSFFKWRLVIFKTQGVPSLTGVPTQEVTVDCTCGVRAFWSVYKLNYMKKYNLLTCLNYYSS